MSKKIIEIVSNADYPYTTAIVDNQYYGLSDLVDEKSSIKLLDLSNTEGRRTYERTITFLLSYAAKKIFPDNTLRIEHSYGNTLYGEIESVPPSSAVEKIKEFVNALIIEGRKIEKEEMSKEDAIGLMKDEKRFGDVKLLRYFSRDKISIYKIDNYFAYFAGPLLPSANWIKVYHIISEDEGFLVVLPDKKNPLQLARIDERPKLFEIYKESRDWAEILKVSYAGDVNELVANNQISEMIKISEALHEKKIATIADKIKQKINKVRVVLIAGPSSSGKTTFSKRLSIELKVNGIEPFTISLDDYFKDRENTPKDKTGKYNFDALGAVDIEKFNKDLTELIQGNEVELPKFDFAQGRRISQGIKKHLKEKEIMVVEGIHGLNPSLTVNIPGDVKFKIYVSALTQINLNEINRVPTRDTRLIRRIVRDKLFRGNSPIQTLDRWKSVTGGEEIYIFPYQEEANAMFNSSLVYELNVLKLYAEPYLRAIDSSVPEYAEALRLINFLSHFIGVFPSEVPPTSILREFIGGSSFEY